MVTVVGQIFESWWLFTLSWILRIVPRVLLGFGEEDLKRWLFLLEFLKRCPGFFVLGGGKPG